ncbi:AroM family protein [Paenibacillus sp. 1-18]|uniref:AroM family protein n=1 Tax=Paenibacillus sp. 1-18 TaxID=1333846 RepID=UPI00046F39EC|nr:AroM family protein [Paenibacillus sp. 1-18]
MAPIVERALEGRAELLQAGALDGLSLDYIQQHLAPSPGEYVLTSRLTTGESVVISREKILPLLQDKITRMEEQGVRTILLLCTGVFPGLHTRTAFLIEPDHVLPPVLKAMSSGRRLGLIGPLEEQKNNLKLKFSPYGLNPKFAAASPYSGSAEEFRQAALQFKDHADLIVLDCRLIAAEGEAGQPLLDMLGEGNGRMLAEFGIGTNDKARITGVVLEDEKVYGTIHVAFGSNNTFGGTVAAGVHIDGVVQKTDVYLDDRLIMKAGQLLER